MMRRMLTGMLLLGLCALLLGSAATTATADDKPAKKPDAAKAAAAKQRAAKPAVKKEPGEARDTKKLAKHPHKKGKKPGHKDAAHRFGPGRSPWGAWGRLQGGFPYGACPFCRYGMRGPGFAGRGFWGGPGPGWRHGMQGPPRAWAGHAWSRYSTEGKDRVKPPSVDELFERVDANGDGVLSKEEFAAGWKKFQQRMQQPKGPGFGPGMGQTSGFRGARPPFGPPGMGPWSMRSGAKPETAAESPRAPRQMWPNVSQLFDRFDKNKDAKLTKDEVPERLWDRIAKGDANKDGAVSKEEFEAAHKKMQEQFRQRMQESKQSK